jgi:regulatory protein
MGIITDIKRQKSKDRFSVFVDGEYKFSLDPLDLVQLGIKVGNKVTAPELTGLLSVSSEKKAMDSCFRLLSKRPRSQKEIKDYLDRKKYPAEISEEVINKLIDKNFINDYDFALWWFEQRQTFKPLGRAALIRELKLKGISNDVLDKLPQEDKEQQIDKAKKILAKKLERWRNLPILEQKKKSWQFLGSRGFSWEEIKESVAELIKP